MSKALGLMQKVRRLMHKVGINFSSCTVPSSENICSSSGGIQEKGKTWWKSVYHKELMFFWVSPPPNSNVLVLQVFFEFHHVYDQTQGSGAVFSLLYR